MVLDYEIIISFSNADNLPLSSGERWVELFQKYLKASLLQLTGSNPSFILQNEEHFNENVNYHENSLLILIVSPDYIQSGLLAKEMELMAKSAGNSEGLENRVLKIVKSPVDEALLPDLIKPILPYQFFKESAGSKYQHQANEWHREYWLRLVDLSYDIKNKVESIKSKMFGLQSTSTAAPVKRVYLAYTGKDMLLHREIIHRELLRQEIEVRPMAQLPDDINALEQYVRQEIENCDLSIHLIGEDYGDIPQGAEKSIVEIQNKLAVELSSMPFKRMDAKISQRFSRLVWISPVANKLSEKQKAFIENIKRDTRALKEDELLQVPFDELKEILQHKLFFENRVIEQPFSRPLNASKEKKGIYLIYEKVDFAIAKEVSDYLMQQGNLILHPYFGDDQLLVRKNHQDNLRTCDASLIICDKVNIEWVNVKLQDLLKAPGFGRVKPFKAKALYIDKQKFAHFHEKLLNLEGSMILSSADTLVPDTFFLFLNKLIA